jgi:AcrR family transcriptional regulator
MTNPVPATASGTTAGSVAEKVAAGWRRPEVPAREGRVAHIVDAARAVLAAEGVQALTMRRIAAELNIQAPSLYKHLSGKHAVEDALIAEGLLQMGDALHRAMADAPPDHAIEALLVAYREVGRHEPNLYRLSTGRPLRREALPEGLEAWAGQPLFLVTGDPQMARALWAFAHGMVILELDGRFPPGADLDQAWRSGGRAFQQAAAGLDGPQLSGPPPGGPRAHRTRSAGRTVTG